MPFQSTRREILKNGLALAGLTAFSIPEWVLPALAQGETLVPFTDIPANANFTPAVDRRSLDIRKIDGPFTPKDQFFTTQHYGHPEVDPVTFRLKLSGLWTGRRRCRWKTSGRWAARNSLPGSSARAIGVRCRDSPETGAGPAFRCSGFWSPAGSESIGARVCFLRRRSWQGRSRVPDTEIRPWNISLAGAFRARRHCRPIRFWPTPSTANL